MAKPARSLKKFLVHEYGSSKNQIKVTVGKDKRVTGDFVVTASLGEHAQTKVLHERKTRIGGMCKTVEERQALMEQIDAVLRENR